MGALEQGRLAGVEKLCALIGEPEHLVEAERLELTLERLRERRVLLRVEHRVVAEVVRRVRLVHALNELGELTVNGLVPQALRDVRELLTAVRNLALFGQGLGNETARRRVVQLRQERGGRGPAAIRLSRQPRGNDPAHDRVLHPVQIKTRDGPVRQFVVEQQQFQQPEFLC